MNFPMAFYDKSPKYSKNQLGSLHYGTAGFRTRPLSAQPKVSCRNSRYKGTLSSDQFGKCENCSPTTEEIYGIVTNRSWLIKFLERHRVIPRFSKCGRCGSLLNVNCNGKKLVFWCRKKVTVKKKKVLTSLSQSQPADGTGSSGNERDGTIAEFSFTLRPLQIKCKLCDEAQRGVARFGDIGC
ncbi:unnamed protein product [Bemisia tabaci]|uniref:Uncharacterized protein n=1 Tax=Bemisia tabaci TaxID=7038 RepID=A0A9P0A713_BEMTA|nr:unnamed protein product [Bemisia tabaci]